MMEQLITQFPDQLQDAIEIATAADIRKSETEIQNVLICGMGGSGIGGDFMGAWLEKQCPVPIMVNKDYFIPHFVDQHTLAIVSSYSGNTEESVSAFSQLLGKKAQIMVISSGGDLIEKAKASNISHIQLPSGYSSPRACLGYSLVSQLMVIQKKLGLPENLTAALEAGVERIKLDQDQIKEKASHIAQILATKLPVIYSIEKLRPVSLRWRQQINENAKMLCWHNSFPELNHNELVGWKGNKDHIAVVVLRNKDDHGRTQLRMNISKDIIAHSASTYMEIWSKGDSLIEQSLYFVHLGDWVSYNLSQIRGEDAVEVKVIVYLKSELSKI